MKHNLFRNFTALLLSGTMLAGVGCKNYDDDIDNINKRLDEMEVTISSLPEQIEAIKSSIPDLSSLTSRVEELEGKLEGVTDLKGQLDALKGLESTLKTYVDNATSAAELRKTLDTYYAAATALSDLELKLTDITKDNGTIDQAVAAAVSEIQNDLTDLKTDIQGWMGDEMESYLKDYATKTYVNTEDDKAVQEAVNKVLEEIKSAQGEYYDALVAAMEKAIVGENGTIKIGKEQLDSALQTLIDKITPLENRVAELEGRIQSLVYVPSTLEEAQNNTIMFKGASWITFDESTKFYLDQADKQTAKITFRVSPASLAEKITKENVSIVTEKIAKTRADEPLFVVTDVTAEKETENEAYTGEFTVTAECNYNYGEVDGETLAIALNVNIAPAEGSDSKFGIDYTTSYIGTDYEEGGEINSKFVVAKELENGTFVEPDESMYETELKYNSDETVTFLDGFSIYYKDGDEYTALSNWENAEDLIEIVAPEEKATTTGTEALYELGTTTAKFKDAKNGSNVNDINKTITSKPFTFNLVYKEKTIEVGSVQHEITIVGANTDVQAKAAVAMTWNYAAAMSNKVYSKEAINLNNVLAPKTYVAMKSYTEDAELAAGKYTVALTKNGQAVGGITAKIELTTTPSVADDAQQIKVTLTGDLKETATYELKAVYMHEDLTTATIYATINVTGMPTLPSYDLSNGTTSIKEYKGQNKFEMLEGFAAAYAKKVWNDELKAAFGTEETLAGIFTGITPTAAGSEEATLSVESGNIYVTFEDATEFGENYQPTLTFTHGTIADLKVLFTSNVQLTKPANVDLKANEAIIWNGQATAQTEISGTSFDVIDKALDGAFFYDNDQSIEGLKVVYSIATNLDEFDGTAPAIVDNKLAWNDWTGLTLDVKAALELNGRQIDEATFTVKIEDPIVDEQITTLENVDATIYSEEANKSFDVATMLKLSARNGENVFTNNDLATAIEGEPSYELEEENPNIELSGSVVSLITDTSLELNPFDVEVKVGYSYKFGKREPITVTVHIVPGAKPAATPGN